MFISTKYSLQNLIIQKQDNPRTFCVVIIIYFETVIQNT